jgi:hypothetical protein
VFLAAKTEKSNLSDHFEQWPVNWLKVVYYDGTRGCSRSCSIHLPPPVEEPLDRWMNKRGALKRPKRDAIARGGFKFSSLHSEFQALQSSKVFTEFVILGWLKRYKFKHCKKKEKGKKKNSFASLYLSKVCRSGPLMHQSDNVSWRLGLVVDSVPYFQK